MTATRTRFIHTSDWQLGMTRAFLHREADARFAQARIDAISAIGALATQHQAEFIVVAGDVFESNQLSEQTLMRTVNALGQLPVPVYLLPGNHDPLDGASIFVTKAFTQAPDHVIVITDTEPQAVPGCTGIEVIGAPWRTKHPSTDLCTALAVAAPPAAGTLRVAVAHGQVDALSPDLNRPEIIDLAQAEQATVDGAFHYLALGDRHSVTQAGTSGRVWYSGAPVATAFDEQDPNHVLLVELTDDSCDVTPVKVGNWSFIAHQCPMNSADDVASLDQWLGALPEKERTAVKVGFEGSINLATDAALASLLERQAPLFASLRRRERTTNLTIVPDTMDQDSVALSGYAKASWNELLEAAGSGDAVAQDALRLLYRLTEQEAG